MKRWNLSGDYLCFNLDLGAIDQQSSNRPSNISVSERLSGCLYRQTLVIVFWSWLDTKNHHWVHKWERSLYLKYDLLLLFILPILYHNQVMLRCLQQGSPSPYTPMVSLQASTALFMVFYFSAFHSTLLNTRSIPLPPSALGYWLLPLRRRWYVLDGSWM